MIKNLFVVALLVCSSFTHAELKPEFWTETSASTASLRTGGARLVSSDSLTMDRDHVALITYWEVPRGLEDRDIYRCIDIQTHAFAQIEQTCWSALTPTGRRPIKP